jgi:ABC-type transport system involved in multi-copper enzyme maturation permease subunit
MENSTAQRKMPLSVKIIIALCILFISVIVIGGLLEIYTSDEPLSWKMVFLYIVGFSVLPSFILIGIWRKSSESVRFLSVFALVASILTFNLIFILLSIAILSASFSKSVQKYCSPWLFEATKEFITSK